MFFLELIMPSSLTINILMVCLGNICRSPSAYGVLLKQLENKNLTNKITVDSAGTGDWHVGCAPDPRAVKAAAARGYDISYLKARQIEKADFERFNYILAMDQSNKKELLKLAPDIFKGKIGLLLDYGDSAHREIPDPYYSGDQGFELVLDLVEDASSRFLESVISKNKLI